MSNGEAECRGCGLKLKGKPYYMGGQAYHPRTGEACPPCFYGGFVCSEACDRRACRELEDSMPGHALGRPAGGWPLSCYAEEAVRNNWRGRAR